MSSLKKIVITGAAGQISYSLLFHIAKGALLGEHQRISLHLLEVPAMLSSLMGVVMELEDGAFHLVENITVSSDPKEAFEGCDFAFLVGAKPRGPEIKERKELLQQNAKIFIEQGKALDSTASKDVKVLVVGNPCNTNCLLTMQNAPSIPKRNFMAMTRLDQNRAKSLLAKKAKVAISEVSRVTIWGNHSSTLVPDYQHARIQGKPAEEVIQDAVWLETEFIKSVQLRGAAVIAARGKSSAASAAHAAIETMQAILSPTPKDDWFSLAIHSNQNPYGIAPELIFSFPCRSDGKGNIEIVEGLDLRKELAAKIKISEEELIQEREMAINL